MRNNSNILAAGFLNSYDKDPDAHALYMEGKYYSYLDLLQMATAVAEQMRPLARSPRIGIYCNESAWTYAALLAVSLSGGCYVPLHPVYPEARLQEVIDACGLDLLITGQQVGLKVRKQLVIRQEPGTRIGIESLFAPSMAYILFTSGSTGRSKGVPVTHENLTGFFNHFARHYDFNAGDRFLQPFELTFDMSVFSLFLAWHAGACAFVVPSKGMRPFQIMDMILQHRITVSVMVPTVLAYIGRYLHELHLHSVRYSFFAGDRLTCDFASLWQRSCPQARIFNCYGPTEATIVCTSYEYTGKEVGTDVPIGKPFDGTEVLLVEPGTGKPAAGAAELCLTGGQVVNGYLHGGFGDQFFEYGTRRYYRTGDLVTLDGEGNMHFLGRTDDQVKISGYRVEPAQVEAAIAEVLRRRVIVLTVKEGPFAKLLAFIQGPFDTMALRARLNALLPDYMVPYGFVQVHEWPLGANEKIDTNALKELYHERGNP